MLYVTFSLGVLPETMSETWDVSVTVACWDDNFSDFEKKFDVNRAKFAIIDAVTMRFVNTYNVCTMGELVVYVRDVVDSILASEQVMAVVTKITARDKERNMVEWKGEA